jgi:hypothetical protein
MNTNNENNTNSNILGPSLSQGRVFRKQQQTRILNDNDVITSNTNRNKNKVNKIKNGKINKTSETIIEPFVQNSYNSSKKYKPFSKEDIANDDSVIKAVNDRQKEETRQSITSYANVSNNLSRFQQGVTDEAKSYNVINNNSELLNKNYLTDDRKVVRVNNKGVVNTIFPSSLQPKPPRTPGINITSSTANPPEEVNYVPIQNIPPGLTKGSDAGLYNQQISSKQINLPRGISGYNLEGENVYVIYPYPNGRADINKNMSYIAAYRSDGVNGLSPDNIIPIETTLNCLQRAVDQGFSSCGMTGYSNTESGGKCMIGNVTISDPPKYAYNVITISQSGSNTTLEYPTGYNTLTFGADGVLYGGHSYYKFAYPVTRVFSSDLDPVYGGTINNLIGSYAINQGNWQNLASFPGNYDPIGQPYGIFNTLYQYNIQVPKIGYYTYYYYNWFRQLQSYQIPYIYYTTETAQKLAAPNILGGNFTYINYNCGKFPVKNPIVKGRQTGGVGYNLDCRELYNNYPSFTLEFTDTGILTITNNTSNNNLSADSKKVTYDMSFGYPKNVTLTNGQVVTLNMPRPDWVSGSVNKGSRLTASSSNTPTIGSGQWISSPNGFCRLFLNGGTLQFEYSLQNVSQDKDGNLVGTGSSIALYSIKNVNTSNLGKAAHIDINGEVNLYPPNMIEYDNVYTEIKGYIPNPTTLNKPGGNYIVNATETQCKTACNNDSTCVGYVNYVNCNLLTSANTFPTSSRIPKSGYSTFIKNPKFTKNDKSCRNTLDALVDSDAYTYYLNNGITTNPPSTMTPDTKCNLGKVLNNQMVQLEKRNKAAVQKGQEIKNSFNDLFARENKVLNSISANRTKSKIYDKYTKKAVDKIKDIQNAQITKSAAEKDSELLLISDNYRYIIWGIISLMISIATIKGLRTASS